MTADAWVLLGKIAGIGGIAVGAFVIIFRQVLRKTVFANLTRSHSFILLLVIVVLTWTIGVMGIWGWMSASQPTPAGAIEVPAEALKSALAEVKCCTEWEITGARLQDDEKRAMLGVIKLFQQGEYEQARQQLDSLDGTSELTVRFKKDFLTGIFFAEGRYKEALISVLARYDKLPLTDVRYRWDIAYIVYAFRKRRGVEECEKTLQELKLRFPRADLSPVWMAIQPRAHERLLISDLYPYQTLHDAQLAILRYVVEKYPQDAFIDHALYFLKDYERILREFPRSMILDRTYYARAYLAFYQLEENRQLASREVIDRIQNQFAEFLEKFPGNNLADSAFANLVKLQLLRQDPIEAYSAVQRLVATCRENNPGFCAYDSGRLESARTSVVYFLDGLNAATLESLFKSNVDGLVFSTAVLQRLVAIAFFKESNYADSWKYYSGLESVLEMGHGEKARMHAIHLASQRPTDEMSREEALQVALAFKNLRYGAERAVPFLARYADQSSDDEDRARALMLQGFAYRNAEKRDEMVAAFKELAFRYPQSQLADDAIAEIGVSYILWGEPNYREALSMFNQAVQRYPNGNAVDNCFNWAAYVMRASGDDERAKNLYQRIRERFPYTRFAKYAEENIEAIERDRRGGAL